MKVYYSYDQIHNIVRNLAEKIGDVDLIIAIGGGGLVPGRILRNFLNVPVYVVTLESYQGEEQGSIIKRQWIDSWNVKSLRVLVVDELNDTGTTLAYCVNQLMLYNPAEISVAVVHDKIKEKDAILPPNVKYHVGEYVPDHWIVYPWEEK